MSDLILQERQGDVAILILNRPERHNSLIPALLGELLDALGAIGDDDSIRAAVLQANGRSFSTGGDIQGFLDHAGDVAAYSRRIVGLLNAVILALLDLPVPLVTAVHGVLSGGSLGFVLGSDVVLVAPEASFTPYYSDVGLSPDGGWATLLPWLIGQRRAGYVLYTNQTIDAETAVAWGLANRVVPGDEIRDEALAVAKTIAAKKPGSIRHSKLLLNMDRDLIAERLEAEREHFLQQVVSDEAMNGCRAFMDQLRAGREGEG